MTQWTTYTLRDRERERERERNWETLRDLYKRKSRQNFLLRRIKKEIEKEQNWLDKWERKKETHRKMEKNEKRE